MALCSCSKTGILQEPAGELHELTLQVAVEGICPVETKSTGEDECFITRLDCYEFDANEKPVSHNVWEDEKGLDLATLDIKYWHLPGQRHVYIMVANLDPAIAEYFAELNGSELYSPESGIMPLEGYDFDPRRPVMGGGYYSSFSNKSITLVINLFRYITKFEIGTITADFLDESMMAKDVRVKRIVFTNISNIVKPFGKQIREVYSNGYQSVFPNGYSYPSNWDTHAFGGVKGYNFLVNDISQNRKVSIRPEFNGTFCLASFGLEGPMAKEMPYIKNVNYKLDSGILNVDVSGAMREATELVIDNGQLCPGIPGNKITVNKEMYLYSMYRENYTHLYSGDWTDQDTVQKMVIEVEIDGETVFYIVSIRELLPNAIYRIGNIVLKGLGSPYSNKVVTSITKGGVEFDAVEIENVEVFTGGASL